MENPKRKWRTNLGHGYWFDPYSHHPILHNFGYQLWLVLCLLFLFRKPKWKARTCYIFIIMKLLSRWYNQGPFSFTFCKVPAAMTSEITGERKISSSWWKMKIPLAFMRLGEEVAVHFMIRRNTWGKDPKLWACFPSCYTQRRDTDMPEIVYIGYRCPQKNQFILLNYHGNTSCLWDHEEREVRRVMCSDLYLQ